MAERRLEARSSSFAGFVLSFQFSPQELGALQKLVGLRPSLSPGFTLPGMAEWARA